MRTTFLNPTLWLLGAAFVSALIGVRRGEDARRSLDRVVRIGVRPAVLAALLLLAGGGMASRVAIGYMSPGAYAEEVLGARAFLSGRGLYDGDARAELSTWMEESASAAEPWTLPGLTPCQSSAHADRPRFYTSQGHPPTLLLASVPVVSLLGGHGLYLVFVAASMAMLLVAVRALLGESSKALRSHHAFLLGAALFGWQPVLATVRQGEVLVVAAGLTVVAWQLARRHAVWAGAAGGAAASVSLVAMGAIPALLGTRLRTGLTSVVVVAAAIAASMSAGGAGVVTDFIDLLLPSARTYSGAAANYSMAGRALASVGPWAVGATLALAAGASAWRGRDAGSALALWLSLGLLAAPITWSQHLVLALVPLAVLLRRILTGGSSQALLAWTLVAAAISAPDPLVARVSAGLARLSPSLTVIPVVSAALAALWLWLLATPEQPGPTPAGPPEIGDA